MNAAEYFKVDEALRAAFQRSEFRFNAYSVAFWSGVEDIWGVNKYLLSKNGTQLWARIEFICPECNNPTASIPFGTQIPEEVQCHVCSEFFTPSLEFSNIVFGFNKSDDEQKKTSLLGVFPSNQTAYNNHEWYQPVKH